MNDKEAPEIFCNKSGKVERQKRLVVTGKHWEYNRNYP